MGCLLLGVSAVGGGSCCNKPLLPVTCCACRKVQTPCHGLLCPALPGLHPRLTSSTSELIVPSHWPLLCSLAASELVPTPGPLHLLSPPCLDITSLAPSDPLGLRSNVTSLKAWYDTCFMFITLATLWNYLDLLIRPLSSLPSLKSKPRGCRNRVCLTHHCNPSTQNKARDSECSGNIFWMREPGKEARRCAAGSESRIWGSFEGNCSR